MFIKYYATVVATLLINNPFLGDSFAKVGTDSFYTGSRSTIVERIC